MFSGQYQHSLDAKGRIAVPAKFRNELGDMAVVTRHVDGCLSIFLSRPGILKKKAFLP